MSPQTWSRRWSQLARAAGLAPEEGVVLALSGGADSVFLLHVLARAPERPLLAAVHVDHGLRGQAGRDDARFCAQLCSQLGVSFRAGRLDLDPQTSGLEARAREARYGLLFEEARRLGSRTILTGHHADDALETVLLRWMRGTALGGLASLRPLLELQPKAAFHSPPDARHPGRLLRPPRPMRVARPLFGMRREEVRRLLSDEGLDWREDHSNQDLSFARNRVRHVLLPRLDALGGPGTLENLRAFGRAVEDLEGSLAGATAHLAWLAPPHAVASRARDQAGLGGNLPRASLMQLPSALRRRALWRLLLEATGRAPRRALLSAILADVERGRCSTHALPAGYTLHLRSSELVCVPPRSLHASSAAGPRQLQLAFRGERPQPTSEDFSAGVRLAVPGEVRLPDGRVIAACYERRAPSEPPPHGRLEVELDGERLPDRLSVRFPRPGDRLHPLGAPGSRALGRFLADSGVPREERERVPLVLADERIAWVAGVRPAQPFRVGPTTRLRLALRLLNAAPEAQPGAGAAAPLVNSSGLRQGELWATAPA